MFGIIKSVLRGIDSNAFTLPGLEVFPVLSFCST